nr:hypothetical protein [Tanacetum cinerariifolium]
MLSVMAVDQMSVPFVHRTSVVCVLAPMETMFYLLHRYCTSPLEETCCSYLLRRLAASYLLRRLANPYLLRRLTISYIPRRLATPYLLRRLAASYLLRRLVQSEVLGPRSEVLFGSRLEDRSKVLGPRSEVLFGFRPEGRSEVLGPRSEVLFGSRPKDEVPTSFNQNHVDQLKAHIVKLRDIPEGALVQFGLSRVWCNPMCDPVLRLMSIYDFLCMPSLDKVTVREEPHRLDTSILGRVVDRTTSPAPAGTAIPRASPEEIAITCPDRKVVTKVDHVAKRKASTGPEISTNATKKTRLSKKGFGAGSSGQLARDGVEQADDGTRDDDDQRDGAEFSMKGIEGLNNVSQVEPDVERSKGVRRTTRSSFRASHGISEDVSPHDQEAAPALDAQPLDADADFLKSSKFNRAFTGVLNMAISVGVECGLRMDRTDEEFRELSQRVVGFVPDAQKKFDRVVATFPDATFPFLDKTTSAIASLRANTHVQHSTSSYGAFGHTSTLEHLKKKKKPVEKRASADIASGFGLLNQYGPTLPEHLTGYGPRART